jgi:hypothetical protein
VLLRVRLVCGRLGAYQSQVRKTGEKTVTRQKYFFGPKTDALIVGSLGLCSFGLWSLVFGFSATVDDLILLPLPLGEGWSEGLPDPNFLN